MTLTTTTPISTRHTTTTMASNIIDIDSQSSVTPNDSISHVLPPSTSASDTESTPHSHTRRKRRKRTSKRDNVWKYARKPLPGVESTREVSGKDRRRIWYCRFEGCESYSVLSTAGARAHLLSIHRVTTDPNTTGIVKSLIQSDLRSVVSQ